MHVSTRVILTARRFVNVDGHIACRIIRRLASINYQTNERHEVKMTKLLVLLSLVLSALLTVGQCTESKSEVIVKEGHRVVAVEYDAVGKTNTRVLITPRERGQEETRDEREVFSNMKKKVTETASSLPVIVQVEEESELQELICDATSKYKHKVASVIQLRTIRRRRLHVT